MTVLEAIQRSAEYLAGKGVESPRRNAEELLAHQLKLPRLELYLNFERSLTPAETQGLRAMVKRRGQREPLQHILGTVCFCGLELEVGRQALVPRPETELLAERAVRHLLSVGLGPVRALDFGTGNGCLAIVMASQAARALIDAVDISNEALELARRNAVHHGLTARIAFHCGDGFAALAPASRFDLIVSNPPYVPSAEIAALAAEVRDFDPRPALDGGPDGLDFYRRLAREAGAWLRPAGKIMLEFGDEQGPALRRELEAQNWVVEAVDEDYSHRPRVLVARLA